jgi:hypothetical protein
MTIEPDISRREMAQPMLSSWSSILFGAIVAAALSAILVAFGAAVGLGVTSTAPTWRDASVALWMLSGLYLILQACVSFGIGGYLAGLTQAPVAGSDLTQAEERDGLQGLAAWAVAVILGVLVTAVVGAATISRSTPSTPETATSAAEPLLSYEIDRLFRLPRRPSNSADLTSERAQAGRILLTSSSHAGMSSEDRSYLIQLAAGATGLAPADAERRVDTAITNSKAAIARTRKSSIILAFSIAAALLLGAVVSWAAAGAGGRHRDGAPKPLWLTPGKSVLGRHVVR